MNRTIPKKKKNKRTKWLSEKALQQLKKEKQKGRKGKVYPNKCRFPKNNMEREGFLPRTVYKARRKQQRGKD